MDVGIFLICNKFQALQVREITNCLSPVMCILDVPDSVCSEFIQLLVADMGFTFGQEMGNHAIIKRPNWPTKEPKFGFTVNFNIFRSPEPLEEV